MRIKNHETGWERGVRIAEERCAACRPSSARRTCRLRDSLLSPERSSRIHKYTAYFVFLRVVCVCPCVLCIGTWTTWKHLILPTWGHLQRCPHSSQLGTHTFSTDFWCLFTACVTNKILHSVLDGQLSVSTAGDSISTFMRTVVTVSCFTSLEAYSCRRAEHTLIFSVIFWVDF